MDLITKQWKFGKEEKTLYFKRLTAGQALTLSRGTKVRQDAESGKPIIEIDIAEQFEKGVLLVVMTLVDASGRQVYRNVNELYNMDNQKVRSLVEVARQAKDEGDPDEDDDGNGTLGKD